MDPLSLGTPIERTAWPLPVKVPRSGRYVDLDPLSETHLADLWRFASGAPDSFTYLSYRPFIDPRELGSVLADLSNRADQPFWTVTPHGATPQGWLSICDIFQKDGSIEIGSVWFSPILQGTKAAREAIFLLMSHVMDDLGYERLVWRCQAQNAKSFKAAIDLGFIYEGTWRRAAVTDGWQRDVAWFSILKNEWPQRRQALERWLAPENFDSSGRQIIRLKDLGSGLDCTGISRQQR
jgi:RimJ/RimL family protein N-acetyltransferase